MCLIKRIMAQYKYKRAIKRAGRNLAESLHIYERNNRRIKELQKLIEEDRKARELETL